MKIFFHSMCLGICAMAALNACDLPQKKSTFDLYDLRPVSGNNDAYYVPPKTYSPCSSINLSPSCGGL